MMLDQLKFSLFYWWSWKGPMCFFTCIPKKNPNEARSISKKIMGPLLFSVLDTLEDISRPAKNKITIKIVLHDKILYSTITCLSRGPLCICKCTKKPKHSNVSGNILEEDVWLDMVMITLPWSNRTIILHRFCLKNEPRNSSM